MLLHPESQFTSTKITNVEKGDVQPNAVDIRLEEVEGQLIATDLRMKTGQIGYAFKFVLAEKEYDDWKLISPLKL